MKAETRMRHRVMEVLRGLHPVAVENGMACPGTPDVNCTHGWIELKCAESWGTRRDGVFKVPHFTPQQRIWLHKRRRADGKAWLLLQVGREWLLLDGEDASRDLGNVRREVLILLATMRGGYWPDGLDEEGFRTCIAR